MPNFIVIYDLSAARPSAREVDDHLRRLGATRSRILETVWHVGHEGTAKQVLDSLKPLFGETALLMVVEAKDATWTKLLISDRAMMAAWSKHR